MPVQQVLALVGLLLATQALLAQGVTLLVLELQALFDITEVGLQGVAVLFEAVQMLLGVLPGLYRQAFGELSIQRLGFAGQCLAMLEQALASGITLALGFATQLLLGRQLSGRTLLTQHPQRT
jgi:hypothetical protein